MVVMKMFRMRLIMVVVVDGGGDGGGVLVCAVSG